MPDALHPDNLPATAFYLLAVVAIVASILVVTRRNPVAQAMNLILTLLSLAGIFALLQAHFVAAIQILVYAGAILVVFIFVIMLLNLSDEEIGPPRPSIAKGLAVLLVAAMIWGAAVRCADDVLAIPAATLDPGSYGTLASVGLLIYRDYLLAFELTSLFILIGIVGAVLLASRKVSGGGDK
ncbi:MAG: NADH-quinone oxidoreductase subunit J [Planctomycetes bacterium]|nr:NADH-quinone oxidoreductase subunit J [Planctomycetota bacterium]